MVSEENAESHHLDLLKFFLVDPLDGTKEFLKPDGQGSFTVNIALIEKMEPVLGVIFAPALDRMFHGFKGGGSVEKSPGEKVRSRFASCLSPVHGPSPAAPIGMKKPTAGWKPTKSEKPSPSVHP